ncbi:hypothetical protein O6H91_23G023300 [Diphasiastrum complanatum]|uniref:Uncharacterized protein n=1 Tax=Diphasiastrum complanatum TaxID=34168 RepID=A0ACC2A925_DIPCM|nr:hypothetical protein O6H91_Y504000 [Diphasiastrum complanatum]KAJ7514032.1 hypothetical protein O6H91_23G023300 [Diphasiastrum complanatum]
MKSSKEIVADRASQWDVSVQKYIKDAKFYLSHQRPGSMYSFTLVGESQMRLSWTLERNGTKLEGRWRLENAKDEAHVICEILDFLMDANVRLREEVVQKCYAFDKMTSEAKNCLEQSQRFVDEKTRFEEDVYRKFVAVLNSKKAKIRELRDALARSAPVVKKEPEDEDDLGDDTDDEDNMVETGEEKDSLRESDKPLGDFDRNNAVVRGKDSPEKCGHVKATEKKHDHHLSKDGVHDKHDVDSDATQPLEDLASTERPNDDTATSGVKVKTEVLDDLAADMLRAPTRSSAPRKRRLV